MAERLKFVLNGQVVTQAEWDALPSKLDQLLGAEAQPPGAPNPALWPMYSMAAGVLPKQIPEAMEHGRRHGYTAEFNDQGEMKFNSQQHQREVLRKLANGTNYGNKADYFA